MKNGSFTNFWFMRSRHWFVIPESRTLNPYPDSFWFMILVIRNKLLQERFWKVNFVRHISHICYYFCETFRSNLQFPTIRLVQIVKFAKCKICCLQLNRRWINDCSLFLENTKVKQTTQNDQGDGFHKIYNPKQLMYQCKSVKVLP